MSKFLHVIITGVGIAMGSASPAVQDAVRAHPIVGIVISGAWAIVGSFVPSPIQNLWDRIQK